MFKAANIFTILVLVTIANTVSSQDVKCLQTLLNNVKKDSEITHNPLNNGTVRACISQAVQVVDDLKAEVDKEKLRTSMTDRFLREKDVTIQELMNQAQEDSQTISRLQRSLEEKTQEVNTYRQSLLQQEGSEQKAVTRTHDRGL